LVLGAALIPAPASAQTITEPAVNGANSSVSTAATTIIAAPGAGYRLFIGAVQCGRTDTGTVAIIVTFNDPAATVLVLGDSGGGGGNNAVFSPPLPMPANTPLTFAASSGVATVYCNAQGWKRGA
jgi:hypothetical protein